MNHFAGVEFCRTNLLMIDNLEKLVLSCTQTSENDVYHPLALNAFFELDIFGAHFCCRTSVYMNSYNT